VCRFGSDKREEDDASKSGETLGYRIMWIWVTCASAELCGSKLMPEEGRRQLKIKIECARSCYDSPFDRTCAWLALVKKSVHETLALMFDAAPNLMQNWEPHALIQNEVRAAAAAAAASADERAHPRLRRIAAPPYSGFCWRLSRMKGSADFTALLSCCLSVVRTMFNSYLIQGGRAPCGCILQNFEAAAGAWYLVHNRRRLQMQWIMQGVLPAARHSWAARSRSAATQAARLRCAGAVVPAAAALPLVAQV